MLMDRKEILRLNNTLISEFVRKKAVDRQNSICCDEIKIGCDEKIKRFLIQLLFLVFGFYTFYKVDLLQYLPLKKLLAHSLL